MATRTESARPAPILLDTYYAFSHVGGDSELLTQLCRAFLEDLPLCFDELRDAIARRSYCRAGAALLRLEGCIVIFGFGHASSTAQSLERAIYNRRRRQVLYLWRLLEEQLTFLVPQVQLLMLEIAPPDGIVH
jgi:hypothetical protein